MKLLFILLLTTTLYATSYSNDIKILDDIILKSKKKWVVGDMYYVCSNNKKYLVINTTKGPSVTQLFNYIYTPWGVQTEPVRCEEGE